MPCQKCGRNLIIEGSNKSWCVNCNPPKSIKTIFNQHDAIIQMQKRFQEIYEYLKENLHGFSIISIFKQLNSIRNSKSLILKFISLNPNNEHFMNEWYYLSYLMSVIADIYSRFPDNFDPNQEISIPHLKPIIQVLEILYFSHISPLYIEKSFMVVVEYHNDPIYKGIQLKFTEKWQNIKFRMEIYNINDFEFRIEFSCLKILIIENP